MNNFFDRVVSRLLTLKGDMNVSRFAEHCGIAQPLMDRYIKGVNLPSLDKVIQICIKSGCSADWLLGLSDCRAPGGDAANAPQLAALEKKIHDLELENAALQKALSLLGGGRHVSVPRNGGAAAIKSA